MLPEERILVFPDHSTHEKLAGISGEDLANAEDYECKPILRPEYSQGTSPSAIAQGINNAMSLARDDRRRDAGAGKYISPRCVGRGAFTATVRDAAREVARPPQTELTWKLEMSKKAATYQTMPPGEITPEWVLANGYHRPDTRRSVADYWAMLKSGAAKLQSALVYAEDQYSKAARAAVMLAVDGLTTGLDLAIATVEHAAILVQSIFNTVATGVDKVVQALSYLFDREHIGRINRMVKESITGAIKRLVSSEGAYVDVVKQQFDQEINGLRAQVKAGFDALRELVGDRSINAPSYAGRGGAKRATPQSDVTGVKQTWMMNKVLGALMAEGGDGVELPSFTPGPMLKDALDRLIKDVGKEMSSQVGDALANDLAAFSSITASQFLSGAVAALLTVIEGMINVVIGGTKALVDGMFAVVKAAIEEILAFVTKTISIPLIRSILGHDLCLLDIVTLPVAVPLTLLVGATQRREGNKGLALSSAAVAVAFGLWGVANALVEVFAMPHGFVPYLDRWNTVRAVTGIIFHFLVIALVLAEIFDTSKGNELTLDLLAWFFWACMLVVDVGSLVFANELARDSGTGQGLQLLCGVFGLALVLARSVNPIVIGPMRAKDIWRLLVFVPEFALSVVGLLRNFGPDLKLVVAGIEGVVGLGATIALLVVEAAALAPSDGGGQRLLHDPRLIRLMAPPKSAAQVTVAGSGPYSAAGVRYVVTFFDDAAETPLGPWSEPCDLDRAGSVTVTGLAVDPSGLARGRRVYRKLGTQGVVLVGQIDDDDPGSTFTDDLRGCPVVSEGLVDASVVCTPGGRLEVFSVGTSSVLWHAWQERPSADAWSAWTSLEGRLAGVPASVCEPDGWLEVFGRGTDGALWHTWRERPHAGAWSAWASLGGTITGNPSVVIDAAGSIEVFARGADGTLVHIAQQGPHGAPWSAWSSLGGGIVGDSAAVRNSDGRLEVFVRGTDNELYHIWQTSPGGAWSKWASLGGGLTSDPVAAVNSDGRLEVFVRGTDSKLYHTWQTSPGGSWCDWQRMAVVIVGESAVVCDTGGRLQAFARGSDNALWQSGQTAPHGTSWSAWTSLGGTLAGDPVAALGSGGRIEVFACGAGGALWHVWQAGANEPWSAWASLGVP
jgi:hypothetical protein